MIDGLQFIAIISDENGIAVFKVSISMGTEERVGCNPELRNYSVVLCNTLREDLLDLFLSKRDRLAWKGWVGSSC